MGLLFIQTGGTIDKGYPAGENNHGYAFEIGAPAFLKILKRVNFKGWRHLEIMKKDSLDMTDKERKMLAFEVMNVSETRVILTHGTDTILKTAKVIAEQVEGKTVVLTGSMVPEKFRDSDADFNLGMAVAAAQNMSAGVYIALRGEVVPWDAFQHE